MRAFQFAFACLLAPLLIEEGEAEPCYDAKNLAAAQAAAAKCETVVRKKQPKSANLPEHPPAPAPGSSAAAPTFEPLPPSPLRPNWVYLGTGVVDAHVGERQLYEGGRPTGRYTGVTLITPFEQSQYNAYPIGPEIGVGWKTPALAAFGITDFGVGFAWFRNSLYRDTRILGFRLGHDFSAGINGGIMIGPVFSGYSHPVAVAAELEFDFKQIAVSQHWDVAEYIPEGFIVKSRIMPCKLEFGTTGQGANAALELVAGFKFSLR